MSNMETHNSPYRSNALPHESVILPGDNNSAHVSGDQWKPTQFRKGSIPSMRDDDRTNSR